MLITTALIIGAIVVTAVSLITVVDAHHFSTVTSDGL